MSTDRIDQIEWRTYRMMTGDKPLPALPPNIDVAKAQWLSVHPDHEPKSAALSVRSGVSSGSSSVHSREASEEPYMGPNGLWVPASQTRHRSVSRSSMASVASFRTDETPPTPMSVANDGPDIDLPDVPEMSQLEIKEGEGRPLYTIPFRPRHRSNRESWDSGLGSDFSGRRRGHRQSASLSGTSDYCSIRSLSLNGRSPRPSVESSLIDVDEHVEPHPIKEEVIDVEGLSGDTGAVEESDSDETVSDGTVSDGTVSYETIPPKDTAERVLKYTLDVAFGLAPGSGNELPSACHSIVQNFISDMSWAVDKKHAHSRTPGYTCTTGLNRLPTNTSTSSTVTGSSQPSPMANDKGKRKTRDNGDEDQQGDDESDKGNTKRRDSGPSKRAKRDDLRMSCPFRKKNPLRFNVRDYRLCALTLFTDTAELRRHIQDVHKRPVLGHHCRRCKSNFATDDELWDHIDAEDRCPQVETPPVSHDPEDGIDDAMVQILKSKKGRVADPVEVQWQKIWQLLFPGTPVQPYEYCAVMEHFELHEKYRSSLPDLRASLARLGLGPPGLDSLSDILDNHFIDLFEQCNEEGRHKDYRNRQPKLQQPQQLRSKRGSFRKRVENKALRDSGVGMDDEAADEGVVSKLEGSQDGTPPLGMDTNDLMVKLHPSQKNNMGWSGFEGFDGLNGLNPSVFENDYDDMIFAPDLDAVGHARHYEPAYAPESGSGEGHMTMHHTADLNVLHNEAFEYRHPEIHANQSEGQWGWNSTALGPGQPMLDLDAWVHAQQEPRR